MATPDVPGANPANGDTLHDRCWAESSEPNDNSLIYVMSVENGTVVFVIYDLKPNTPALQFMDSMHEADFKSFFSWDPKKKSPAGKWIWHDKSPFPIQRIMKYQQPHGQSMVFGSDQMSAAQRVAAHMNKRMQDVDFDKIKHNAEEVSKTPAFETLMTKIGKALDRFLE
jgi:hypothetical protein